MNSSWVLAQVKQYWLPFLLALGVSAAWLSAKNKTQPPGIWIGVLAFSAALVSLRPPADRFEKVSWIVAFAVLAILEIRSIRRSDEDNIQKNREILDSFTGGSSYLRVIPTLAEESGEVDLAGTTVGAHTLWDVSVKIDNAAPVELRSASSSYSIIITRIPNFPKTSRVAAIQIAVYARNRPTYEMLVIRWEPTTEHWLYSYKIYDNMDHDPPTLLEDRSEQVVLPPKGFSIHSQFRIP